MKVIVIGAGAAGLTAAITAARSGASVTIIEHENKPGKKILVTGNGKCNMTNTNLDSSKYHGNSEFAQKVIEKFDWKDTINLFTDMGLSLKDKSGYIYPMSEQASSVINTLRDTAINLGVSIKTNNEVSKIERNDKSFLVHIGIVLQCDKLIISTGGKSFPKTGSRGDGYEWARSFGHRIISPKPALTAIVCEKDCLLKASGVRITGNICITDKNETPLENDFGELQITDYGISGIPVFNISHLADADSKLIIDFMPDTEYDTCKVIIEDILKKRNFMAVSSALNGYFNDKFIIALLERADISKSILAKDISNEQITNLISLIKKYTLKVKSVRGFDFAQVTKGGIDADEICPDTMESKIIKNLYFAGEIIDVDGICGGYNLQFAWASGVIAGRNCI